MSAGLNKVTLIGHVGADPDVRSLAGGGRLAGFSLATSQSWRDRASGERRERTEWHRVVVFAEGLVGVVERYVRKGSRLYLEGELRTRKWQDRAGADRWTTEVVLTGFSATLLLLGDPAAGRAGQGAGAGSPDPSAAPPGPDAFDDDIPF